MAKAGTFSSTTHCTPLIVHELRQRKFGRQVGEQGVHRLERGHLDHDWAAEFAVFDHDPDLARLWPDLGMGPFKAMVRFAARHERPLTVEDMLAKLWRALFLDAWQAARTASAAVAFLQGETGLDPRLDEFLERC